MKRVAHVMSFYDVPGRVAFSGAENHLFTLMAGQQRAGWQVELVMVIGLDGERLQAKAAELRASGIGVTCVNYPVMGLGRIYRYLRPLIIAPLAKVLRRYRNDIVHIHPLTGSSGLSAAAAAVARCRHVVYSYHNNEPFMAAQPHKTGMQMMDKLSRRTIAISQVVADHLIKNVGLDVNRVRVVHYGIEMPTHQPDRAALRARLGVPTDCFLVGLVGRLIEQKDIPTFLKALAHLPKVQGVIIGGGDLLAPLQAQAKELRLTNIVFAGPHPDGPDLIGCLDLMVLPSAYEGLGLVLLEAMVRHVPIVGSTGGAIPEVTEQGKLARLFPVGDVDKFVAAIEELRTDEAARAALIATAYARAQEKYTVEAMVGATSRVYEEAFRDAGTPVPAASSCQQGNGNSCCCGHTQAQGHGS